MNKKAMTWSMMIYMIIGLIVLITIIIIFRSQINQIYQSLTNIITGTTAGTDEIGKGINDIIKENQ